MADQRAQRYATWVDAHRRGIQVLALLIAIGCAFVASHLPVRTDLTKLLPHSARSVQQLEAIQRRARPFATIQVVLESHDPAALARAGATVRERLAQLPPDQVLAFSPDDRPLHRFVWDHRFLLAKRTDLIAARDALTERLRKAKLAANPLFIDIDPEKANPGPDRLDELEHRIDKLEREANAPPRRLSRDGTMELFVVQTAYGVSDYDHIRAIVERIDRIAAEACAATTGVTYGLSGNAPITLEEHDSVLHGMALSVGITVLLCALALVWYYRSGRAVLAMLLAVGVGVCVTFAFAYVAIGHLDMMSAFLIAIVVGNGINAGLILMARYFEEIRTGTDPHEALGPAIRGSLLGTLGATATAAIAYGSLVVTDFRGFRHFGAIAAFGMSATWIATYTVLPALLSSLARGGRFHVTPPPAIGAALARLIPRRRFGVVVAIGVVVVAIAGAIAGRYIAGDPFTKDWRDLQSSTREIREIGKVGERIKNAFDSSTTMAAQAYLAVIAVEHRDQLAPLVDRIRLDNSLRPAPLQWLRDIRSLDDLVPPDQDAKREVLAQIRHLIDDPTLRSSLDDRERAELLKVRPPDHLAPITDADVPAQLIWPFVERDGSVGKIAILRGSSKLDSFNVADRLRFAAEVRAIELPPGAQIAGEAMVVADIIDTMERDTPWMVTFALLGAIIGVIAVVGRRRHGAVTLACGLSGVVVMIATCALVGLRVHFVDLIALPITIGIGIDYSVNLAIRDREQGVLGPRHLISTTGSAVLLCSFTTTVGYATLLLSANGGIRAFGLAALIGEISCIAMALLIAPALLAMLRHRAERKSIA